MTNAEDMTDERTDAVVPSADRDLLRRVATWALGIHASLVGALLVMLAVGSGLGESGLALLVPFIFGVFALGWPWPWLAQDTFGLALGGPVLNLGIHAALWTVVLLLRRWWRTRQHP